MPQGLPQLCVPQAVPWLDQVPVGWILGAPQPAPSCKGPVLPGGGGGEGGEGRGWGQGRGGRAPGVGGDLPPLPSL